MMSPERVLADEFDLNFFPIGECRGKWGSGRLMRCTLVNGERRLGRRRPRLFLRPRGYYAKIGGAVVEVKTLIVDLVRGVH